MEWFADSNTKPEEPDQPGGGAILASESGRDGEFALAQYYFDLPNSGHHGIVDPSNLGMHASKPPGLSVDHSRSRGKEGRIVSDNERDLNGSSRSNAASSSTVPNDSVDSPHERSGSLMPPFGVSRHPLDHHGYRHAKKRLRKAVVEHYRCVELFILENYAVPVTDVVCRSGSGESVFWIFLIIIMMLTCGMYL